MNYLGVTQTPATSVNPLFVTQPSHNFHLQDTLPCKNAGLNSAVLDGYLDIDGERRIQDRYVDIGADEVSLCKTYVISFSPDGPRTVVGGTVQVQATVTDFYTGALIPGAQVDFTIDSGQITAISPDGHIDTGGLSGYGTTGANGKVSIDVTRNTEGYIALDASVTDCGGFVGNNSVRVFFFAQARDDWPMFMHDSQHTGMSKTWDDTSETLTRQWVVDLPTASTNRVWPNPFNPPYHPNPGGATIFDHPYIDSSPVVVGNKVVVGTWPGDKYYFDTITTGSVKAFNGETGATLWTAIGTPAMGGVASTPCIYDGKVYVGTSNGYLYCLNLSDGSQIWARETTNRNSTPASSRIISSPVVHNGVVYITNEASKVYAFTADNNGTLVAGYPIELPIYTHGVTSYEHDICGGSSPAIATVGENTYQLILSRQQYTLDTGIGMQDQGQRVNLASASVHFFAH